MLVKNHGKKKKKKVIQERSRLDNNDQLVTEAISQHWNRIVMLCTRKHNVILEGKTSKKTSQYGYTCGTDDCAHGVSHPPLNDITGEKTLA